MIIALDYDGTYTVDENLWEDFIVKSKEQGHQIYIVTMRHFNDKERIASEDRFDRVFYTGRMAKNKYLLKYGIKPDIWIDDNPYNITEDYF